MGVTVAGKSGSHAGQTKRKSFDKMECASLDVVFKASNGFTSDYHDRVPGWVARLDFFTLFSFSRIHPALTSLIFSPMWCLSNQMAWKDFRNFKQASVTLNTIFKVILRWDRWVS